MTAGRRPDNRARDLPSSRVWQAGFVVGAVVGAVVTVAGRRIEHHARAAGLVDWHGVESVSIARLRSAPG